MCDAVPNNDIKYNGVVPNFSSQLYFRDLHLEALKRGAECDLSCLHLFWSMVLGDFQINTKQTCRL